MDASGVRVIYAASPLKNGQWLLVYRQNAADAFRAGINKKAVECACNYYGVHPQNIADKWMLVSFSLLFYVIDTVWYGFAVLFMFEGWGLKLKH